MAEIGIKTEVAGRVCQILGTVGGSVNTGDELIMVEAMKMEIPVATPKGGRLKSILVKVDDVVSEDQVIALVDT